MVEKSPKRILFISHEGSVTGAPIFLGKFLKYLKIKKPEYSLAIFFSKTGEMVEFFVRNGFEVFVSEKSVKSVWKISKLSSRIFHYVFYLKVLLSYRPDLVYSNTCSNFGEVILAGLLKFNVLIHVHEGRKYTSRYPYRLRFSCFFAKRIIVGSHYVNSVLISLAKRQGIVVYNGVDLRPGEQVRARLRDIPLMIGILGTIDPNKGQLVALEAIRLITESGLKVKLKIAGMVSDEAYYAEICNFVGMNLLDDYVEFVGVVPDAEAFLRSLDLLLVPSFDEAFPTVILEAFAVGTLVVASNVGGIPEIIQNEVNGVLVMAGDSVMLADAIEKIIVDEDLMQRLALSALRLLREKFDLTTTNNLLATHLDELLFGRR